MTAAVPILLGALAIIGAVFAAIWLFITRCWTDVCDANDARRHDWRERQRKLSHDRQYR
jgi:hypothetical protein